MFISVFVSFISSLIIRMVFHHLQSAYTHASNAATNLCVCWIASVIRLSHAIAQKEKITIPHFSTTNPQPCITRTMIQLGVNRMKFVLFSVGGAATPAMFGVGEYRESSVETVPENKSGKINLLRAPCTYTRGKTTENRKFNAYHCATRTPVSGCLSRQGATHQ